MRAIKTNKTKIYRSVVTNSRGYLLLIPLLGFVLLTGCQQTAGSTRVEAPPLEVPVTQLEATDIAIHKEWVATIDGSVNAQIQPQVVGYLIRQNYKEGTIVRKGDVLFEIDPRPFQASLDEAKGQLAKAESQVLQSESQVAQASAQLRKAEIDVHRDTPLAEARAISQSQLDTEIQAKAAAEAALQAAKADVAASKAAVQASKAAVERAELNLEFTKVRSLVDGIAGIAQLQIGNLVNQQSVLTTVSQVNPIRVYFPISEQEYLSIAGKIKPGAAGDLLGSSATPVELVLSDGSTYPHKGHIIFSDRQVDQQTGTIRVAAAFPNPGSVLRPGLFGRVRGLTSTRVNALLIPQRSVSELQGQYQAAVVGADNKVQIRKIQLGLQHGSHWIVEDGLKAGERVITDGILKVGEGSVVKPILAASNREAGDR